MNSPLIERVIVGEETLALVVRHQFATPGANFFTPPEWPQQLGMLVYEKGKRIRPHKHRSYLRETETFTEVLILVAGRIKVDLFDANNIHVQSVILEPGDSILFVLGGHAVEILEDAKILEVKQGPYIGREEKEFI